MIKYRPISNSDSFSSYKNIECYIPFEKQLILEVWFFSQP